MAVIKCKMCGGDLDISEGLSVCECEYCGTKQTVPTADNEKKLTLFARANRLRLANEFDKAAGVYESIVADFPEEAEAYWGLVLCRYGIEYVDDPATGKKVPTCHRVSFDSVLEDSDFEQACENADAIARRQYREEAKQIEDIRRGIIEVSGKEDPYDIFICYKETDENGDRTIDSVIAQDVYDALTEKGYRVFFSRISLEDKLGAEYEPYIFAALNSAKIMLAFGTDYEYYNAVWVKNEWSRFLKLMEKDKSKHLIPCYKGIDAYDMPKEFHRLQGQDMGKVGAVQDLLRGIEKILPKKTEKSQPVVQQVIQAGGPNVTAQLKRGFLALEDGNWEVAQSYFDKALDMDAESADAYLGTALSKQALHSETEISALGQRDRIAALESDTDYQKFLRFAPEERKTALDALLAQAKAATSKRERREAEEQRRKAEELRREADEREKRKPILAAARERLNPCRGMIAAGIDFTVGLRAVGSVLAVGSNSFGQCSVNDWTNIVAVSAGFMHAVGLRADGTVLAVGTNNSGQCSVNDWRNIVAIDAGDYHTVGLHTDGSALAVGSNSSGQCNIGDWKDIISIAAGSYHTVGLRADGSVLAVGNNNQGQCDVAGWHDIVAVAAGSAHTVGLRADGSVLAVGSNEDGQCNVGRWKDIVAVAAGICHTVGLNADGSVLAVGSNGNGRSDVDGWTGIAAVTAGSLHTVGFRADGTVLAVGDNRQGQCDVGDWKLFNNLDTLDQERKDAVIHAEQERKEMAERAERKLKEATERKRKEAAERAEQERREAAEATERVRQAKSAALTSEKTSLQTELANLKGLFSGKRRKEIEARLGEIEAELKKLQ